MAKKSLKVSLPSSLPTQQILPTATPAVNTVPDIINSGSQIKVSGLVMLKNSSNTFILRGGNKSYTVIMNETGGTQVINSRGSQVPWQFIQVGGSLTVTGAISGSTINAQVILIPTIKDRP